MSLFLLLLFKFYFLLLMKIKENIIIIIQSSPTPRSTPHLLSQMFFVASNTIVVQTAGGVPPANSTLNPLVSFRGWPRLNFNVECRVYIMPTFTLREVVHGPDPDGPNAGSQPALVEKPPMKSPPEGMDDKVRLRISRHFCLPRLSSSCICCCFCAPIFTWFWYNVCVLYIQHIPYPPTPTPELHCISIVDPGLRQSLYCQFWDWAFIGNCN